MKKEECNKSTHGEHEWIKNNGQSVYFCICCGAVSKKIKEEKLPTPDIMIISDN